jgi:hypothetical protein
MHFGSFEYVKMHGLPQPMVEVELTEDPEGTYYGWIENDELRGALVWPKEILFEMCFAYGSKMAKNGTKVRLTVKEV